jgi:hypothetical protein
VPLQSERHLRGSHAAAVVDHLDAVTTAFRKRHSDTDGTGVDCVFNQFFQCASRSFDNFAGSDPINEMFGESPY